MGAYPGVERQGDDHPALYAQSLTATDESFVNAPPQLPLRCTAKVRYRSADVPCIIQSREEGHLKVVFDAPQKAITPRQSIVFYDGDICLGGAIINDEL